VILLSAGAGAGAGDGLSGEEQRSVRARLILSIDSESDDA
jgi:hypothetical protein